MIAAALRKFTGKDEAALKLEEAKLAATSRDYERSLGRLAEDEHKKLDRLAQLWREQLKAHVRDGLPESMAPGSVLPLVATYLALLAGVGKPVTLPELLAELTAEGALDSTPRAEIQAKRATFQREIQVRKLARERREQEARLEAEKAALEEIDRRAQKALAD